MTASCHPIQQNIAEELLQLVARSICDRPSEHARQRESRTRQMVHTTLGFEPRDGLEYMLSTMVVGHFHLILDSMRDALQGQMDQMKAKTKTTIVSLDRAMLSFIREMRVVRRRPVARSAEETPAETSAAADPTAAADWIADWSGVTQTNPHPQSGPVSSATPPEPASPAAAEATAMPPRSETAARGGHPVGGSAAKPAAAGAPDPSGLEDATTQRHIAAFEDAVAALAESLRETHALDAGQPLAMTAGGD